MTPSLSEVRVLQLEQELFNGEGIGLLICWCTLDIAHSTCNPLLRTVGKCNAGKVCGELNFA